MLKVPEAELIIHRWRGDLKVREGREAAAELHNDRIRMTVRQLISIGASPVEEDRLHGARNYIMHVAREGDEFYIVCWVEESGVFIA